jgi:hypothetical protein
VAEIKFPFARPALGASRAPFFRFCLLLKFRRQLQQSAAYGRICGAGRQSATPFCLLAKHL